MLNAYELALRGFECPRTFICSTLFMGLQFVPVLHSPIGEVVRSYPIDKMTPLRKLEWREIYR